jgi:uncharacterized membrane protein
MSGSGERVSLKQAPAWMKLLLLVSLIGNAVVVGILCGTMLQDKRRPEEPGLSRTQTRILYMVPESKREATRTILLARKDEIEAAREAQFTAQAEMMAALKSEPFSADRLAAALAARHDASGRYWGIGYEQIADVAVALTPEERAAFADAIEEQYRRWQERRRRRSR